MILDDKQKDLKDDKLAFDDFDNLGDDKGFNDDFSFGDDNFGDYSGPVPMDKHSDLLKNLTNFDPFIKDKVNGWLGLIWDDESQKYVRNPAVDPLMNEKCASWCVEFLKIYTRGNNIITDISRDSYRNLVEDVIEVVWYNIGTRMEEFDIRDNGDVLKICVELQHAAELVLMGAGDGRYNKMLGSVTTRTENVSVNPYNPGMGQQPLPGVEPQPRGGFFKNVVRKLKGG